MSATDRAATRPNLRASLSKQGKIQPTLTKVQALRPFIENVAAEAKKGSVAAEKTPLERIKTDASALRTLGFASLGDMSGVSASVLKNKFSEVIRRASGGPLAISRHNRREFVILTAAHYEELQQRRRAPLEALAGEFDQLVARMNTPKARRATAALFAASGKALGEAAVKARRATHA
jgi:prevent-host-death family protein